MGTWRATPTNSILTKNNLIRKIIWNTADNTEPYLRSLFGDGTELKKADYHSHGHISALLHSWCLSRLNIISTFHYNWTYIM